MTTDLSQSPKAPQRRSCATMTIHYQLMTSDLRYAAARRNIENQTIAYSMRTTNISRVGVTTIPVVVHILYNTPESKYF